MSNEKILSDRLSLLIGYRLPKHGAITALAKESGIPRTTWSAAISGRTTPNGEILYSICNKFPEYALWLMTGQTNEDAGQSSPEIDQLRELEASIQGKSKKRA